MPLSRHSSAKRSACSWGSEIVVRMPWLDDSRVGTTMRHAARSARSADLQPGFLIRPPQRSTQDGSRLGGNPTSPRCRMGTGTPISRSAQPAIGGRRDGPGWPKWLSLGADAVRASGEEPPAALRCAVPAHRVNEPEGQRSRARGTTRACWGSRREGTIRARAGPGRRPPPAGCAGPHPENWPGDRRSRAVAPPRPAGVPRREGTSRARWAGWRPALLVL